MLEDAELFITVVEQKNFSKAANKLKLSASIVTRRVARMEKKLGVRLLQRNTRQVVITEAGALFYESCLALLKTYRLSIKHIKNIDNGLVGTLKIGLPSSISYLYVIQYLRYFTKKYPDLKIDIICGNHLIDLLSSGFDLIIHCGELADSNLYCCKLGEWTKVTCATPAYLKRVGIPKVPDDLRRYNCLDHYDNRDGTWKYYIKEKIVSVPITGNVRVNNSMDLKQLALTGLGVVYLPSFIVKEELESGRLKSILNAYQVPPLTMYAVYPTQQFLSKKAKVFIDFLTSLKMTV